VVEGEATVEGALGAAQQTFDEYRACVFTGDGMPDETRWGVCLEEVDPVLAKVLPGDE